MGFILHNLNTFIYKIFEGYHLLARFSLGQKCQKRKYKKLESRLNEIKKNVERIEEETKLYQYQYNEFEEIYFAISEKLSPSPFYICTKRRERIEDLLRYTEEQLQKLQSKISKNDKERSSLEDERYYIISEMQLRFPLREKAILPTGFGNILRAAEAYPADRYGIDAVRLWPRLVHVIPKTYYEKVEQSNNGLAFLINCSVLSLFLSILSIAVAIYQFYTWKIQLNSANSELFYIYSGISLLALIFFFIFYRGSFPIVKQYGNMIRSSYDLFRMQLLEALNLELPKDSVEEYQTWRKVSEFVAIGEKLGPLPFDYEFHTPTKGSDKS